MTLLVNNRLTNYKSKILFECVTYELGITLDLVLVKPDLLQFLGFGKKLKLKNQHFTIACWIILGSQSLVLPIISMILVYSTAEYCARMWLIIVYIL